MDKYRGPRRFIQVPSTSDDGSIRLEKREIYEPYVWFPEGSVYVLPLGRIQWMSYYRDMPLYGGTLVKIRSDYFNNND